VKTQENSHVQLMMSKV